MAVPTTKNRQHNRGCQQRKLALDAIQVADDAFVKAHCANHIPEQDGDAHHACIARTVANNQDQTNDGQDGWVGKALDIFHAIKCATNKEHETN